MSLTFDQDKTLIDGQETDHRQQYERNMARLAALDRLLAALKAYQADPWSHSWQPVLAALKEINAMDEVAKR